MGEQELQRRSRQRDLVLRADRLDLLHFLEDRLRRRCIIIFGAGNGTGREDAAIEAAANDDGRLAFLAERQEFIERVLFELPSPA